MSYFIDDAFVVNLIKIFLTFFDDCDDDFVAHKFDFFIKCHCERVKTSRISIKNIY